VDRLSPARPPEGARHRSAQHGGFDSTRTLLAEGRPYPLGATVSDEGINFAVFSGHATQLDLCLFEEPGGPELARLPLPCRSGDIWHGFLPGARAGQLYGLRAHGPWRPGIGHRFNPNKLLLDPWAREIVPPPGGFDWRGPHFGADRDFPQHMDPRDNARGAFKARAVLDRFDWSGDRHPRTPMRDSVLYEVHVKGFSRRMPGVPEAERGTYAGLASDAAIAHFKRLGITALSLLPVHHKLSEGRLSDLGLVNYWGYNTLGFFAPEPTLAATEYPRDEFRRMVKRLHAAGIEVLLDVVYNHTPEGDERGPTLAWRGLDNAACYHLAAESRDRYLNHSGCGNTVNVAQPRMMQMVLDSLRYWVAEMHVDGFRFDLAPVLARDGAGYDIDSAFFKALQQDPTLQGTKLIAEPWDIGPGGYQVGQFPRGWGEWNDRFRDTARAFWLGGDVTRGEFAQRFAGSSDIYQRTGRLPEDSVNYVISHDGFTLADLVSYDLRHNEANGENNRDGTDRNLSWNCGWEGPTTDPEVLARRTVLKRSLLATLLLSQGTPMMSAGDELGHTQHGNNNPYCQDNEITWIDWSQADATLIEFTAHVLAVRKRLRPLGPRWYTGLVDVRGRPDLAWLRRNGGPMSPEDWNNRMSRILGAYIGAPGLRGDGDTLLLLVNGRDMDADFRLPPGRWVAELDTTTPDGRSPWRRAEGVDVFPLRARSLVLLRDAPNNAGPTP
jgi:glycogen operon protein